MLAEEKTVHFKCPLFLPGETAPYAFFQERKIFPSITPVYRRPNSRNVMLIVASFLGMATQD